MKIKQDSLIFFFLLPSYGIACVATVPTTTTVAPVTMPPAADPCTTCTTGQIDFIKANGNVGSIDSNFRVEAPDANGCLKLTAVCLAQPGFTSFMQFNINQGGPAENQNMARETTALLECINGEWVYDKQRVVTAVDCTEAPGP